jgi:photosystem II stability/assembly factor-like uncharacterized protein
MKLPQHMARRESPARAAARAAGRQRYPFGKALARIRYFEQQRGLDLTRYERGRVTTAAPQPPGTRAARAGGAARPRIGYAAAANAKAKLEPSRFAAAVRLPVWRELGPTSIPHGQTYGEGGNNRPPVSGRCVGLAIDPRDRRRLVLCSAGGGLWGSHDRGATWQPLTDYQPTLAMGAVAIAPNSPNILYAGTGEGDTRSPLGLGLLRSRDGGTVWEYVPSPAITGTGIYDLAVDPGDPLHVWIGAVNGLFESRDGGVTVRAVRGGLTWDISINPSDPREMFVACDAGLLRSTNSGATWSRAALSGAGAGAPFDRMEVCHAPSNPGIVYVAAASGASALLWRRASAGGAFSSETPPRMDVSQAWYDWCLAVSPADPNVVYWGAIELYRGTRSAAGWRWSNISSRNSGDSIHPDHHHIEFDPGDPNAVYVCNDGGLFRSPDGGTRWEALNPGLGVTEFEFLAHLESEDTWLIGGTQDNGTLGYAAAAQWNQIALGDGGDCTATDGTSAVCFHSYYGMWIERAPAKGPGAFRWTDVSPPAPDSYDALFYPPMELCGQVIAKAGKSVFVSDDAGDNWSEVLLPTSNQPNPDLASAIAVVGSTVVFVGTARGMIYRITRGNRGWANARVEPLASPRAGFVSDISVPGLPNRTLWTTCSEFGGGHVFRSTNGGRTWSNRSGNLPDIPVNAVVVDPANSSRIFAATDNGVYRTTDGGRRWIDFSNGLPNALVGDLIIHARRRVLRAGTRNRGCWEVDI